MSARAWERRNNNKRKRLLERRLAKAFDLPRHLVRGGGSYTLVLERHRAYEEQVLRPMFDGLMAVMGEVATTPWFDTDPIDPRGAQDLKVYLQERLGTWTT